MRRLLILCTTLLACITTVTSVKAEVVDDLYGSTVPVRDQGASALILAARLGLGNVLIKVSGSQDALSNPEIAKSVSSARSHVQQYSYLTAPGGSDDLRVRLEFDADFITDLVLRSGEPLWTANRPAVLAWVVVEDERGERFISRDSDPELVQLLREAFAQRGVPLQLPIYDLADTAALRPSDVRQQSTLALLAASERYGLEHVVSARLVQQGSATWAGGWAYLNRETRAEQRIQAENPAAFMREGVAVVAQKMAARYAVLPSTSAPGTVALYVSDVSNYADYALIVSWLERLELVHGVRVRGLAGNRLELGLDGQADAVQLATLLELNRNLVAAAPPIAGQPLEYRWQR